MNRLLLSTLLLLPHAGFGAPAVKAKTNATRPLKSPMTLDAQLKDLFYRNSGRVLVQKAIQLLGKGADPNAFNGELFRYALIQGNAILVRAFLQHGAKATSEALGSAIESGVKSTHFAEILLNRGADPNGVFTYQEIDIDDEDERKSTIKRVTPLILAIKLGDMKAAQLLLERGARINLKSPNGETVLQAAALATESEYGPEIDNLALCKLLLNHHADWRGAEVPMLRHIVEKNDLAFFDRLQKLGALPHPIHWPAGANNLTLPMAKKLVTAGAIPNVDASQTYSASPLQISMYKKDFSLTLFLLDHGAKVRGFDLAIGIPEPLLSQAQQKQQAEVLKQIPKEDQDPFSQDGEEESPQSQYDPKEDLRWLKLLLERGASPNSIYDMRGNTPLHLAARNNRVGAVRLLLAAGAKLEVQNREGDTPLLAAVRNLSDDAVPILLDAGAKIEAHNAKGNTPILLATAYGGDIIYYSPFGMIAQTGDSDPLIQLLLQRGADVHATNLDGATALHYASATEKLRALRLLLAAGAKVDAETKNGVTPLNVACQQGRSNAARLLLEAGANPDLPNVKGKTPRQFALQAVDMDPIRTGRRQIEALLRAIPIDGQPRKGK